MTFSFVVMNCTFLPDLNNGMVSYNPQGQDQTLVGATATYTCDTGYTLNGNNTRTCQASGTWSGTAPTCDGKYSVLQINKL